MSATTVRSILIVVMSVVLAVMGQTTLKAGATEVGRVGSREVANIGATIARFAANPRILVGLLFYSMSAVLYIVALSRLDLSVAYPIVGLSYPLITLIAWLLLHEPVSLGRWLGVALITIGVFVVASTA